MASTQGQASLVPHRVAQLQSTCCLFPGVFFFFPWCFLFWIQAQRGPLRRKLGFLRCRLSAEGTACQLAELRRTVWSAQGPLEPGQGWQPRAAGGQDRGSTSSASPGSLSPTQARSLPALRGLQGQAAAVLGRGSHWYVG